MPGIISDQYRDEYRRLEADPIVQAMVVTLIDAVECVARRLVLAGVEELVVLLAASAEYRARGGTHSESIGGVAHALINLRDRALARRKIGLIVPIRPDPQSTKVVDTPIATAMMREKYPEHACPTQPTLYRSRTVIAECQDGQGNVQGVYLPTRCGCRVTGDASLQHPLMIEPCPDHFATMYPVLAAANEARVFTGEPGVSDVMADYQNRGQ